MSASADTIDTVKAMLFQEADYSVTELQYSAAPNGVNSNARAQMVEWCCRVVDYCKLQTETVCIAMNYTDRMCVKDPSILTSRAVYQLVAMTALYTGAKIHAKEALDPKLVSDLSRGTYTVDEIEEQERQLVSALQWRLNPPTAHSFVRQYLALFSPALTQHQLHAATLCALGQTDIYAFKHHCSTEVGDSVIAYCAVMNALEYLPQVCLPEKRVALMGYNLAQLIGLDSTADEDMVSEVKYSLLLAFQEQQRPESSSSRQSKRVRISEQAYVDTAMEQNHSPRLISER
jgi:Cyclin, N-terminal domain